MPHKRVIKVRGRKFGKPGHKKAGFYGHSRNKHMRKAHKRRGH